MHSERGITLIGRQELPEFAFEIKVYACDWKVILNTKLHPHPLDVFHVEILLSQSPFEHTAQEKTNCSSP